MNLPRLRFAVPAPVSAGHTARTAPVAGTARPPLHAVDRTPASHQRRCALQASGSGHRDRPARRSCAPHCRSGCAPVASHCRLRHVPARAGAPPARCAGHLASAAVAWPTGCRSGHRQQSRHRPRGWQGLPVRLVARSWYSLALGVLQFDRQDLLQILRCPALRLRRALFVGRGSIHRGCARPPPDARPPGAGLRRTASRARCPWCIPFCRRHVFATPEPATPRRQ